MRIPRRQPGETTLSYVDQNGGSRQLRRLTVKPADPYLRVLPREIPIVMQSCIAMERPRDGLEFDPQILRGGVAEVLNLMRFHLRVSIEAHPSDRKSVV